MVALPINLRIPDQMKYFCSLVKKLPYNLLRKQTQRIFMTSNRLTKVLSGSIAYSGGWSPNWVHSAPRPFTVLLCLPPVIVRMENYSVE
jgi:hypothetical protein